jgi:sigma-B regulation protein RsbU (phosphoserine phosphatase)
MRSFVERGARDVEALEIGHDDEIREIADSYRQMTADICDYVARIETMTHERATAETELSVAQRIQLGLVPPTTELVGDRFEAFAFTHMAREVGGDFYDLSPLADGRVLFVLADVSGKGVSAALFMAMCRTLLHEKLCTLLDPAQALNEVNDIIEANNPENMFVTLEAGIFDPTSGLLTYANAGHTPPIIVGTGYASPEAGIPLGIFEDAGIVNETIRLAPGQGLLLYTDGATDAMGADGEFFGEDRLLAAVGAATSPEDAVLSVVDAIGSFTDDHEQFDDLTLLSLFAKET